MHTPLPRLPGLPRVRVGVRLTLGIVDGKGVLSHRSRAPIRVEGPPRLGVVVGMVTREAYGMMGFPGELLGFSLSVQELRLRCWGALDCYALLRVVVSSTRCFNLLVEEIVCSFLCTISIVDIIRLWVHSLCRREHERWRSV